VSDAEKPERHPNLRAGKILSLGHLSQILGDHDQAERLIFEAIALAGDRLEIVHAEVEALSGLTIRDIFQTVILKGNDVPPSPAACALMAEQINALRQEAAIQRLVDRRPDVQAAMADDGRAAHATETLLRTIEADMAKFEAARNAWSDGIARAHGELRDLCGLLRWYRQFREMALGLNSGAKRTPAWHGDLAALSELFTDAMESSMPDKEFGTSNNGPRIRFLTWAVQVVHNETVKADAVVKALGRSG